MQTIYTETHPEITDYYELLCNEDCSFLDPYIATDTLQNLAGKGQFCGCDYTAIYKSIKYYYSRLYHSIVCARMTYHFTLDKVQAIAALLHDVGTPSFSHCIDFLKGDALLQESSEKSPLEVISKDKELLKCLRKDSININDVVYLEQYSVVENKKPKICVDRLDGVLHTNLIWLPFWSIENVRNIYQDMTVLKNELGEDEIGFTNLKSAEKFYEVCIYIVWCYNQMKTSIHYSLLRLY